MVVLANGTIRGRRIELDRDTGLPDGADVTVRIEAAGPSLEERQRRMRALCGAWSGDDSVEAIFAEIAAERELRPAREIDFDDPS